MWIICVIYVLCLSCFRVCSLLPCGHLKGKADLLALVCDVYCDFVTFPFCILGQVWYLIVSIPDPCCLSYVDKDYFIDFHRVQCHEHIPLALDNCWCFSLIAVIAIVSSYIFKMQVMLRPNWQYSHIWWYSSVCLSVGKCKIFVFLQKSAYFSNGDYCVQSFSHQ